MDATILMYPGTIRFERLIHGTCLKLWEHLTTPELLAAWLGAAKMDLRAGGKVELHFGAGAPPRKGEGERVRGVIATCVPARRLSYSWGDSLVTFELIAQDAKTVRLVLTQSGMKNEHMQKCGAGWHAHLATLAALRNGERPKPFGELLKEYKSPAKPSEPKDRREKAPVSGGARDRRRSPRGNDFV